MKVAAFLTPLLLAVLALAAPARPAEPSRVVVAVLDTGVTPTAQLAPQLLPGIDLVDGDADASDLNGHGTELASIVARQCGLCRILPVRVLGQGGFGAVPTIVQGIRWGVAHGASVLNLSATTRADDPDLSAAIEWAVAQGVTVTVAAGNDGSTLGHPGFDTPDAIVVGSADANGNVFKWSNHGPWVDVYAPGRLNAVSMQGHVVPAIGTSVSAAYVAGVAGRLLGCAGALTPAVVRQQLEASLAVRC